MLGGETEATPGFSYDDAVGWVVQVIADLDGQVGADVANVFGEGGDVLGTLIGDACDAVIVDEKVRSVGGVIGGGVGIGNGAVGYAAPDGELFATRAFNLFGGGLLAREKISRDCGCSKGAHCDGGYASRRAKGKRHVECNGRKHRACPKNSLLSAARR